MSEEKNIKKGKSKLKIPMLVAIGFSVLVCFLFALLGFETVCNLTLQIVCLFPSYQVIPL